MHEHGPHEYDTDREARGVLLWTVVLAVLMGMLAVADYHGMLGG